MLLVFFVVPSTAQSFVFDHSRTSPMKHDACYGDKRLASDVIEPIHSVLRGASIDNVGEETVTVLGREWRIFNEDGSLHREIRRGTSESSMVVGLQPVLEPGDSFIYHSGTDVKSSSGYMEGSFQVSSFH